MSEESVSGKSMECSDRLWMPEASTSAVDDPLHQYDSVLQMVWVDLNSRPRCTCTLHKLMSTTVSTG